MVKTLKKSEARSKSLSDRGHILAHALMMWNIVIEELTPKAT